MTSKRARVHSKGGAVEWVFWQTGAAQLLPRLLAGRTDGPVFLADRLPTRAAPTLDLDPATGRPRLSYRRAAAIFAERPAGPSPQLRHSALTHAAEVGTNLPLLLARSRHASVRSLERYAEESWRRRPAPTTWSAIEYLAHTGDGVAWYHARVTKVLSERQAQLEAFDFDVLCDERDYRHYDLSETITALDQACSDGKPAPQARPAILDESRHRQRRRTTKHSHPHPPSSSRPAPPPIRR